MKYLFFLGHPAHFHLFKNVIHNLNEKGHKIFILIKKKDILEDLLKESRYEYINVLPDGRTDSLLGIVYGVIKKDWSLAKFCLKNRPDLMLGSASEITHIGKLLGIPSIVFSEDDEAIIKPFARVTYPFASNIISPKGCNNGKWNYKTIFYNGYQKLAYLHPNFFSPNKEIVKKYFPEGKNYYLLRFAKLNAYHDVDAKGFTTDIASRVIDLLSKTGDVYITSERELEPQFEKYRLKINPLDIHHIMYYADIYLGDSQSMAVEAAILGTPSVRFSDFSGKIGVLEDLEHKYQLTYGIKTNNQTGLLEKLKELINTPDLKRDFQEKRMKMLADKIDVTAFFSSIIGNYPEKSIKNLSKIDFTIQTYKKLLGALKLYGFEFLPYKDFQKNHSASERNIITLRHDVDDRKENSLQFARIQHALGIVGTYYFRVVPESYDEKVIAEIAGMGHEIGYHYETMDTNNGNVDKAYDEFCRNLEMFRKIVPINTICMHGSPQSKYDNRDIWSKYDYKKLGLVAEPYFDVDFNTTFYLTDTGRMWNGAKVNIRDKAMDINACTNPNFLKRDYHSTNDIIKDLEKGDFPNQVMMTFHPQRWTDNKTLWYKELVVQNLKNQVKRFLVK